MAAALVATLTMAAASGCNESSEIPCLSSRDCSSAGLVCDLDREICVECLSALDCFGTDEICRANTCVAVTPCTTSRTCPGQVCDTTLGYCVDCTADTDCTDTQRCASGFCEERPPPCDSDRDCSAMSLVCDLAAMECVPCVRDADCGTGSYCEGRQCYAQECTPGAAECVNETAQRSCDASGRWNRIEECSAGLLCSSGTCTDGTCVSPCLAGESCQSGACFCGDGPPCEVTQQCVGGACVSVSCFGCGAGETCGESGACMCGTGPSCPAGQSCVDGACSAPDCVPACGTGESCSSGTCRCGSGAACGLGETCVDGTCTCETVGTQVDLLFMVDDSNSMLEEQTALAAQLPIIVRVLATGDLNLDGTPEFPAVEDLHLGVVTSDMGVGGFADVASCERADFGDDGILSTQGQPGLSGCTPPYPNFLSFRPESDDPLTLASDFACVARAGTQGCGFEQQLEAVLKAVTPSASSIRFHSDTRGHGDTTNAGFLRPDSVFAAIVVTDENDCSAANPAGVFDPDNASLGVLNLRCFSQPGALHPVSRYVDGILALRADPRDVIFAAITGIPSDLVSSGYPPSFDSILSDSRMVETPEVGATFLEPSCDTASGRAFPPRRIVQVARDIDARGATGVLGSICQADFSGPVQDILDRLLRRLDEACVPP